MPRALFAERLQKALLALQAVSTTRAFVQAAVRLLRAAVSSDAAYVMLHCYGEIGRASEAWGTNGRVFDEKWMRGHHAANPTLAILAAEPGRTVLLLRDCYRNERELLRSHFYRRYLRARGSRYAVGLFFWDQACEAVDCALTLHRGPARSDFTSSETAMLAMLHPHIAHALQRITRQQNESCARASLQHLLSELPLPTILLDWEMKLLFHNAAARDALAQWRGHSAHVKVETLLPIPADIRAALEEMRLSWSASLRESPLSTAFHERQVEHRLNPALRATLSMSALRSSHFGKPSFLLRFDQIDQTAGRNLTALTRLSLRERELASLVCEGKSNQEIADKIGRNLSTVKSELHSVFRKLNVSSRGKLAVLLR